MAGNLLNKLTIPTVNTAQANKSAAVSPAQNSVSSPVAASTIAPRYAGQSDAFSKIPQLEYSAAATLSPAGTTPIGITPHSPQGRLIHENILQSSKSTVKSYGQYCKYLYNAAVKGEGTDYSVGKINDLTIRAGSLGIAGILAATKAFPFAKGMEFIGLATWFGSMAVWPKVIGAPIKALYGVNINQKYEDSYGRRKSFFEDPQYLPWDLYRHIDKHGKFNKNAPEYEYLDKIGDKLGIPRNIQNRREAIQDKMRQIATQGNTLWMLTAGVMTPVISSIVADTLQGPVSGFVEKARISKGEKLIANYEKKIDELLSGKTRLTIENVENMLGFKPDKDFVTAYGAVAKEQMNPKEYEAFETFLNTRYRAVDTIDDFKAELKRNGTLTADIVTFDGKMQDSLVEATNKAVESLRTNVYTDQMQKVDDSLQNMIKIYNEKGLGTISQDEKISDVIAKINSLGESSDGSFRSRRLHRGSLQSKNINLGQVQNYSDMTVKEVVEAIKNRDFKKLRISFLEDIKGVLRADIDDLVNAANVDKRSDGLGGRGQNSLIRGLATKIDRHVTEILEKHNIADSSIRSIYSEQIAKYVQSEVEPVLTKFETNFLNVEKAKRLLSVVEIHRKLDKVIDKYAKATIQDISESATANTWNNLPKEYLKIFGFTKKELALMAMNDTSVGAQIIKEKFDYLLAHPEEYDKAVKAMSKLAKTAVTKEQKALVNLVGTVDKPGILAKISRLMKEISNAEGFTETMGNAFDHRTQVLGERYTVKLRNTVNSFARPIKALDCWGNIDDFVKSVLKDTPEKYEELINSDRLKWYTFVDSDYKTSTDSMRSLMRRILIERNDINSWSTKYESNLENLYRGIKHNRDLLMRINEFTYGNLTERTGKLLDPEFRSLVEKTSLETGVRFMSIKNKLLPHVSECKTNRLTNIDPERIKNAKEGERVLNYVEEVFKADITNLTPAQKKELMKKIDTLEYMIEGRRFEFNPHILTDHVNVYELGRKAETANLIRDLKASLDGLKGQLVNYNPNYNPDEACKFVADVLGRVRSANSRISKQTGKGIADLLVDAAVAQRSRNKWLGLVWPLFAGCLGLSAVVVSLMGKKNYFNKDIYALKGGKNANNQ